MQPLSDKPRSNSVGSSSGKSSSFEPVIGWKSIGNESNSKDEKQKIIIAANNILSLKDVFSQYKVRLDETYSSSGWAFKGQCPFDDHNDSTPSFGYNPNSNVFNCFGCHRGGKAVEFIAFKEGIERIKVARRILQTHNVSDLDISEINGFDFDKLKQVLFDYADYVLLFKKKHNSKKALKYEKDVNWNIDVFLRKNSSITDIELINLEARIEILKEQLDLFEEDE